jgi:two-component system cell cycle response regulator
MGRGSSTPKDLRSQGKKILLIDENPKDIRRISEWLHQPGENSFSVESADRLSSGLKKLSVERYSLVLLNLALPDSTGLETFIKVHKQAPDTPIIVQGNITDESVAVSTVQQGAQDYLIKSDLDGKLLIRSIRYAIERQHLLEEIRSLSLVDELTGLYNRRGFTTLAEKQLKVSKRANERMHFIFLAYLFSYFLGPDK